MRARDSDLETLWRGACYHFEQQGLRVPPLRWRVLYAAVHWIFVERGQW